MRRTRWPWALLFIGVVVVIAVLATSWNWVLVANSRSMLDVARDKWANSNQRGDSPWLGIVLGSLGFGILIFVFSIFFAKVLREMRLNQMQKDFLANITHELKTPLASLELSSNLLKTPQNLDESEKKELWETHDIELLRLRDEIEQLLISSRWEQFQEKPQLQSVSIEEWLQKSMKRWNRKLPKGSRIKRLGQSLDKPIEADPALLNLIANNIIDNAIKFSGSLAPQIEIESINHGDDHWSLHFRDHGIGFESDDSELIFKRFKRLKHLQRKSIPGTGLGLHLASSAAKAMDIKLIAFSDGPTQGACFTLKGRFL